ncbi:monooxygenase, FAD-binding [Rhizorhabdus wittichii RW1]|uniref:Flavin-dependent monooxygenase n=1 Tax=Rhizorhabdus wittichii (strain DSM 6014 / CCUG 31198 / JCM 15750 / NBRC 105917 / EY 4224 / RW1) TaxID=392499 RepID=A0A9J9LBW4_RHIWR|nr:monooxygenase, FAD-binding [Rhizorhabdus wittichii RW1]
MTASQSGRVRNIERIGIEVDMTEDDATSPIAGKKIAIVGAGPSGLTLARLLQMRGGSVTVYDLDPSLAARNQGGSLDLHEASGQLALKKAGLLDLFHAAARPEGQATRVLDHHGKIYVDLRPSDETSTRPEIDRGTLQSILFDSLEPGTVKWGRRLLSVERNEGGGLCLRFADDTTEQADLVFGSDGAWSRVRPMVSPDKPRYSDITFIEGRISAADTDWPDISRLVGEGAIMVTGDNRAILAQRNSDGHIRLYACLRETEEWIARQAFDFTDPASVRTKLLAHYAGWSPEMLQMLTASDDQFVLRPIYTHEPTQHWTPQPDVTLTGDAAHVMPPFTGKGVNLAMQDALELADALTGGEHADVASALRAYESGMLARMEKEIRLVLHDQDIFVSPIAPQGVIELFEARLRGEG